MSQSTPASHSGTIALTVKLQPDGHSVCEMTTSWEGRIGSTERYHGQSPKHAIAVALDNLARAFRREAEAEQQIDCDAVNRSSAGKVIDKRFHVILHYERVTDDASKFEAMHNTLLGNTVIENAEVSIIQVDPDVPIKPLTKGINWL